MSHDGVRLKGFVRVALEDVRGPHKGRVQMSDWTENIITDLGFKQFIVAAYGTLSGSKYITHMAVGSGTAAPTSNMTSIVGEFTGGDGARGATTNSSVASHTLQCVASWATDVMTQSALGCVALYGTSSGGTACSVATLSATSQKTTDQTLDDLGGMAA